MAKRRAHGDGSVFKRERDSKWVALLELPRGLDGKRRRKTFTASTEREARARLREAQRDLEVGRDLAARDRSVGDFLQWWYDAVVSPSDRSQSTKVGHEINVRLHLRPTLGHIRLAHLEADAILRMHSAMASRGSSARTQQSAHVTLRAALSYAVRTGVLDRNVASMVSAPRPRRDPSRVHELDRSTAARLISHTRGRRLHALWVLLLTTGLRKGEALALRWADIDLDRCAVRVERSMYRISGGGLAFKPTKTANSTRTVPLAAIAIEALQQHRRRQIEDRLTAGVPWTDHDLVFCGSTGHPLDLKVPNIELRRMCRELGIEPERVHNLRHTAATIGGDVAGGDLAVVSRHLGHASIRTTIDMYRHAVSDTQRALADGIAEALMRAPSSREGQVGA